MNNIQLEEKKTQQKTKRKSRKMCEILIEGVSKPELCYYSYIKFIVIFFRNIIRTLC